MKKIKIFSKRCLTIFGILLGIVLMLTGCGKNDLKVKTYDKENEEDVRQISKVENTNSNEETNKARENVIETNETTNTAKSTKKSTLKAFSDEDLVVDGKFRLGESAKAVEAYYGDNITSVNTSAEGTTGREIATIKLESLGIEVENLTDDNDADGEMIRIKLYGNSKFKTAREIKIGDSREKVINAYQAESILKEENGCITVGYPGDEPVYESNKGKIYFTIESGKVTQILYAYGIAE